MDDEIVGSDVLTDAGSLSAVELALWASELLDNVPLGPERAETVNTDEFIDAARFLVLDSPIADSVLTVPEEATWTAEEAVAALEAIAASRGSATARVRSVPSLINVTYRPVYREASPADPVITTDDTVALRVPMSYYFDATNPYTGETVSQRKKCAQGCTVVFNFGSRE